MVELDGFIVMSLASLCLELPTLMISG